MGAIQRFVAALPDAVTAAVFLLLWIAPLSLGGSGVRNAMLVMLVEFVLVHATGFMGAVMLAEKTSRIARVAALLGFTVFYLLFIGTFVAIFREWWPLLAFAWLLLAKIAGTIGIRRLSDEQRQRIMSGWALAVVFYVGGVFATIFIPLPRFGLQADLVPALGLTGGGLWVDEPHRVIAFGCLYFGLTAWSKWRDWTLPGSVRVRRA